MLVITYVFKSLCFYAPNYLGDLATTSYIIYEWFRKYNTGMSVCYEYVIVIVMFLSSIMQS